MANSSIDLQIGTPQEFVSDHKLNTTLPGLYGMNLHELETYLPFLQPGNKTKHKYRVNDQNLFIKKDNGLFYCKLCKTHINPEDKKTCMSHFISKKHNDRIQKLNSLQEIDIQGFIRHNKHYFNCKSRLDIKMKPINISNNSYNHKINSNYLCPLTNQIMKEPVLAGDGYTYDKVNIQNWFKISNNSPKTGNPIDKHLTPNLLVKKLIKKELFKLEEEEEEKECCNIIEVLQNPNQLNEYRNRLIQLPL